MPLNRRHLLSAAALGLCQTPLWAQSAPFPQKPIRYVVPFAAGGLTDVMARMVGQRVSEALGQPILVDNKPGASANLGAEFVAKAEADGHTWLAVTLTHAVNQSLFPKLNYNLEKDMVAVAHLATSPLVLVVNASHPAKTLAEFLAWGKGRPVNGGSSGNGSPPHLGLELLAAATGLQVAHVAYRGGAPSLNDLMGGTLDFIVANLPEAMPHVQSGRLRALAVTAPQRVPLLRDVPTFTELGQPDVTIGNWTGLLMPAATPPAIVERVAREAIAAVKVPATTERLAAMGFTVTGLGPAEYAAVIKSDVARWRGIVQSRGLKPE